MAAIGRNANISTNRRIAARDWTEHLDSLAVLILCSGIVSACWPTDPTTHHAAAGGAKDGAGGRSAAGKGGVTAGAGSSAGQGARGGAGGGGPSSGRTPGMGGKDRGAGGAANAEEGGANTAGGQDSTEGQGAAGGQSAAGGSKTTGGAGSGGGRTAGSGGGASSGSRPAGNGGTSGGSVAAGGTRDAEAGSAGAGAGQSPSDTRVENESADCTVGQLPDANAIAKIPKLPDPFIALDGKRLSTKTQWHCRRQEIRKQAEKYIYGEKPTPALVTGAVTKTKVSVHVEDKGKSIDFSAEIVLPSKGKAPFPALINVGAKGGFGGLTLGESRVLDQGVAVIYYNNYDLGVEGTPEQSRGKPNQGKFYELYGSNHSAGLLMAWAWGASRILDVLQKSGGDVIDASAIGVTGCSRNGKGAFAVGVFDDRIALTIPQETSTAGVPAYRIADVLGKERTDHNYFGLNWLSNNFEPFVFKNNTSNAGKLPIDTHALIGAIAPRGLLVLENPHQAQMGAPAGHMATVAGARVYQALGVEKNVSYHSSVSDTAHCSYKTEYTALLAQCISKFLKNEGEAPGKLMVGSGGSLTPSDWLDWTAPTLQ